MLPTPPGLTDCHAGTAPQVLLLGLLSFVVFFLERSDLASRLGIVVTLFLAMAAVQFVIAENQPASSYVLPTQQVAGMLLLVVMGVLARGAVAVLSGRFV